jgi:hypothetical protein
VPAFERRAVPNPNANTANAITKHFFPMIEEFLLLFRRLNPTITAKLPRKMAPTDSNSARHEFFWSGALRASEFWTVRDRR